MKVIGHRGFAGKYPQNTMLSFKKAVEAGCDEIELDIQITKDNVIVIFHDEMIDDITDGAGYVRELTFQELSKVNVVAGFGDQFGFNQIPSFEDYIKWVKDQGVTTNIELKNSKYYYEDLEEKALAIIKKYDMSDRVMFSSFNYLSLVRCKELAPDIKCGVLGVKKGMDNPGYYTSQFNFEFYHPYVNDLTDEKIENCKTHGVGINVWTVNKEEEFQKLYDWGCDGIITDHPDICRKWLDGQESK